MARGTVTALVGAQYGSEGKGRIAQLIANEHQVHVRTGGPNAGHTIRHEGEVWKMQQIPVGWINPDAMLVIGAGAVVDLNILDREAKELEDAGYSIRNRLFIDQAAAVILHSHRSWEGGVEGDMHKVIGSTGEGVGICRMSRIARGCSGTDLDTYLSFGGGRQTTAMLDVWLSRGLDVLLEGTQGSGLSLIHGEWPWVTSADTNAAQLFADAGLSPAERSRIILVARTYPIRVAGASGPLRGEMGWDDLGQKPERTTVTNKIRRIGSWDDQLFGKAVRLNRPDQVAITFVDYLNQDDAGVTRWENLSLGSREWIYNVERQHGVDVVYVGTGGPDLSVIRRRQL